MKISTNKIRMSYFETSVNPWIVLFGPLDIDLSALQQFFWNLSQEVKTIRLDQQPFIIPFGRIEVSVKSETQKKQSYVKKLKQLDDFLHFEWAQSSEEWIETAELLEGMNSLSKPCHQYLTDCTVEDATIIVSKGEYSDECIYIGNDSEKV